MRSSTAVSENPGGRRCTRREVAHRLAGSLCGLAGALGIVALPAGCRAREPQGPPDRGTVVVYTALDRAFSEPILKDFERQTGIRVRVVYDTESTKTVGLVNRIRAEAARPRCDLFWNNEILNTLRLKREGLLQPSAPAQGRFYPARYRDPEGFWYGFAARARVLLVNTRRVPADAWPDSIRDLADPRWAGQVVMAKPLFGTTASHVACLFASLGPDAARDLLRAIRDNDVQIAGGNKGAAELVGAGRAAVALTDTDDALVELEAGRPVHIVLPDSRNGQMGTLLLPNTLAIVRGAPHPEAALQLMDWLLSAEVEARLAAGPSAQIPLHAQSPTRSRVWPGPAAPEPEDAGRPGAAGHAHGAASSPATQDGSGSAPHIMDVDFAAAAACFDQAAEFVEREFLK